MRTSLAEFLLEKENYEYDEEESRRNTEFKNPRLFSVAVGFWQPLQLASTHYGDYGPYFYMTITTDGRLDRPY